MFKSFNIHNPDLGGIMSWIELKLDIANNLVEQISAYLFAHGCEGINVREEEVIVYFSTHRWSNEVKVSVIKFIQHVYKTSDYILIFRSERWIFP